MFITEQVADQLKDAICDVREAPLKDSKDWLCSELGGCGVHVSNMNTAACDTGDRDRVIKLLCWWLNHWFKLLDERICLGRASTSRVCELRRLLYDKFSTKPEGGKLSPRVEAVAPASSLDAVEEAIKHYSRLGFAGVSIGRFGPSLSPCDGAHYEHSM